MTQWLPVPRDVEAIKRVSHALDSASSWLIVTHERPDGDALGSALAMAHILTALGKQWTFLVAEPLPERFQFLPMYQRIRRISEADYGLYHDVVAVDCADEQRFEAVSKAVAANARVINIDHHQTNPRFGEASCVDAEAAATCELIYHVALELSVSIDVDLAKCLYTGILTDTGGFSYPNTTRAVHQIAAELLECGVQPYDIAEPALEARTRSQMTLLQLALRDMYISHDGRYAFISVNRKMLEEAGASEDDVEGLVAFARSVETVEVGVLLRERPDGKVKASLRSKRQVDVSVIAQQFGGGGHARAAGCVLEGPLTMARQRIEAVVSSVLEAMSV
ncbi:bifunctional oligoribonuclease/PAP phosphatase NrnA [Alicyclobacillus fastidiosus]|uniref:Bifunctional oligoribonuclease/PAP phosphatase NrnA n=1 Tax=Alicyclobacillus fastidiosus TaxID=392011 RepID=A0ABY6ZBD2_9BACL|nr:bifunctional oligoribonuclease/PAP phosphatase NrnA [Alicyclobacillus fastidiosus]WAH40171.1 bifunctional oligoribonuclease/PAP phosphatase NrnA [Alicyclobacillus fastidiosus]GMA61517.1 phosphoesterase RecJ-like protein [Alicyclobacillus fastidiosus]